MYFSSACYGRWRQGEFLTPQPERCDPEEGVRDRARLEKRLEINNKRLELAKAHREEEASNYFRNIASLTKLFGAN